MCRRGSPSPHLHRCVPPLAAGGRSTGSRREDQEEDRTGVKALDEVPEWKRLGDGADVEAEVVTGTVDLGDAGCPRCGEVEAAQGRLILPRRRWPWRVRPARLPPSLCVLAFVRMRCILSSPRRCQPWGRCRARHTNSGHGRQSSPTLRPMLHGERLEGMDTVGWVRGVSG